MTTPSNDMSKYRKVTRISVTAPCNDIGNYGKVTRISATVSRKTHKRVLQRNEGDNNLSYKNVSMVCVTTKIPETFPKALVSAAA